MVSLSYAFRISHNSISKIIRETCNVIWECLMQRVLSNPSEQLFRQIAEGFHEKWQLPNCVGAIDGKHVIIQALPKSGSSFFNYKGSHSIVFMALCDANYKFTIVDIGAEGRHSDGGILKHSYFGQLLSSNSINFPSPKLIGNNRGPINHFIVGDEAFPLTTNIMRPYSGRFLVQEKRIFNYRLCRARRLIENTFGLLAARWRIYRKPIIASYCTVVSIIKATVCLHNFLMTSDSNVQNNLYFNINSIDRETPSGDLIEGDWREQQGNNSIPIGRTGANMYSRDAEMMRQELKEYFMNEGAVCFQWNK